MDRGRMSVHKRVMQELAARAIKMGIPSRNSPAIENKSISRGDINNSVFPLVLLN